MKLALGLILVVCGVVLGLYVGGWVCFVGGIIDVIEAIRADALSAMAVAVGVAKVVFAGFFGWLSFAVLGVPGLTLIQTS